MTNDTPTPDGPGHDASGDEQRPDSVRTNTRPSTRTEDQSTRTDESSTQTEEPTTRTEEPSTRTADANCTANRTRRSALTRRAALGAIGAGLLAGSVSSVSADEHEADVWLEGDTWHAEAHGSAVYSGGDMFAAVQSAIDGLSSGRTSKETVVVHDGGAASGGVTLPSYTVLDVRETIEHSGDDLPIYADGAHAIEIPNYALDGTPGMGMRLQRCSDVSLGTIEITGGPGIGIRIDNAYETGNPVTTENVRIDYAYVEATGSHGVETYGVDDIEIGTVEARDTGGCGLLFNDTSNASVELVDAVRANEGGGYAGFRCANSAGPNIHVDEVRSVDCGRGIFTVSGSYGITVDEVYLEGNGGNLIQNTQDVTIGGGILEDNGGEGFRIDSRSDGSHHESRNVTIRNCGIYGHSYGVRETGPGTESNAIVDNDFCDNGTDVETYAANTVVEGNTNCEGQPDPCDDAEPTPIDPYLRVDGGEWQNTDQVAIEPGSVVEFGPHPTDADGWSWSGPAASDSSREIEVTPDEDSSYTATYTNDCEETSSLEFTVTVDDADSPCEDAGAAGVEELAGGQTVCDLNGDDNYRDVNGDGSVSNGDVVDFFSNQHVDPWDSRTDLFDFDGDGGVGQSDVVALFEFVS